jgi:exonuclease SbcD
VKILHTADWHVGKALAGRSRAEEHQAVLGEITDLARSEAVDLILVTGDLFDSASPSAEAERIVYEALLDLSQIAQVVLLPGNHDSERRLAAVGPLLELARVNVRSFVSPDCLEFMTPAGEKARIATVPWLSQRYIVKADQLMGHDADELSGHFEERMRRIIKQLTASFSDDAVNIVAAHLTIGAATHGGGERTAHTILDYCVPPTVFPSSAHYVALGHIHKMQKMAGPCPIYYAGAPLHLDFSDDEDDRHVLLVEASPGAPADVRPVALAAGRKLRTLKGTMADLTALQGTTGDAYLRVLVSEAARVGLGDEVRELFGEQVIKVIIDAPEPAEGRSPGHTPGATPHDLFGEYLASKSIEDPALVALFDRLYEEAHATHPA